MFLDPCLGPRFDRTAKSSYQAGRSDFIAVFTFDGKGQNPDGIRLGSVAEISNHSRWAFFEITEDADLR